MSNYDSLDTVLSDDRVLDMLDTLGLTEEDVRWYVEERMSQRAITESWNPEVKTIVACALMTGQEPRDMKFHFKFLDTSDVPMAYVSYHDPELPLKAKTVRQGLIRNRSQFNDNPQKRVIARVIGENPRTKLSVNDALREVGIEYDWEDFERMDEVKQ